MKNQYDVPQCDVVEAVEHPRQPVSNRAEPPHQVDPYALQIERAQAQWVQDQKEQ
ncbi:hypothetical protein HanPSC8_Chr02g0082361 [Helianthus annuus]|nr:hypothetical protein HanPSC8_Chr02g0082361 [Helianthus annuus]